MRRRGGAQLARDEGARGLNAPRQLSGRGLAYWTDGNAERILYVTPGYQLVALDAATGNVLSAPLLKELPALLEFDPLAGALTGVLWDGSKEWLVRVDEASGVATRVAALAGVDTVAMRSNAFDAAGGRRI